MQCRGATDVDRFSKKKSFIKKLRRSDLGLHYHPFSPGDLKVLLNVAAFQENLYFREI